MLLRVQSFDKEIKPSLVRSAYRRGKQVGGERSESLRTPAVRYGDGVKVKVLISLYRVRVGSKGVTKHTPCRVIRAAAGEVRCFVSIV
jgi:hypothetical protein